MNLVEILVSLVLITCVMLGWVQVQGLSYKTQRQYWYQTIAASALFERQEQRWAAMETSNRAWEQQLASQLPQLAVTYQDVGATEEVTIAWHEGQWSEAIF